MLVRSRRPIWSGRATLVAMAAVVALLTSIVAIQPVAASPSKSGTGDGLGSSPTNSSNDCIPDPFDGPAPLNDCGPGGGGGGSGCNFDFSKDLAQREEPDSGERYFHVDYNGHVSCTSGITITGSTQLVDRTPGYDGNFIGFGGGQLYDAIYSANSQGVADLYENSYPVGEKVEVVFYARLQGEPGFVWRSCTDTPGVRFLRCDGLGTETLDVEAGSRPFASGLVAKRLFCFVDANIVEVVLNNTVNGTGTIKCNQKANLTVKATLYRRAVGTTTWVQQGQTQESTFPGTPKETTRIVKSIFACPTTPQEADWKVEVYGKGVVPGIIFDSSVEHSTRDVTIVPITC